MNLPDHRAPFPKFGGTGKDPVWGITIDWLGDDLIFRQDKPNHGLFKPAREMSIDESSERSRISHGSGSIVMTGHHLIEGLQGAISARVPLAQVAMSMREYRQHGVTREQVRSALEALRERAPGEETEDRILEILDIVSGFCPRETNVWDD